MMGVKEAGRMPLGGIKKKMVLFWTPITHTSQVAQKSVANANRTKKKSLITLTVGTGLTQSMKCKPESFNSLLQLA